MSRMELPIVSLVLALVAAPAAHAQPAAAAAAHAGDSARAARLTAVAEAAGRGDAGALARALAAEPDADARRLIAAYQAVMQRRPGAAADPQLLRLAGEGVAPELRRAALAILSGSAFSAGDYPAAVTFARTLKALQIADGDSDGADKTQSALRLAELLAAEPRLQVEGGRRAGAATARRDAAGLMRIDVAVNGHVQEAVFDTGANLSVLSSASAARLGVRLLDGDASVGNSVQGQVPVRLGIADHVEIAGNVLRNVAFLVIDDAQLTFPQGYAIPAIIGFPEMRALGRFTMRADRFTVGPVSARAVAGGGGQNLHAADNELFVDATVGGIAVPLHLDSGANPSHLNATFAAAHPQVVANLPSEERRLAGAGGNASGRAARWTGVPVGIAGRSFRAPAILVGLPGTEARPSSHYGVLGADVLRLFASYTIDIDAMRLELGEPVTAPH